MLPRFPLGQKVGEEEVRGPLFWSERLFAQWKPHREPKAVPQPVMVILETHPARVVAPEKAGETIFVPDVEGVLVNHPRAAPNT